MLETVDYVSRQSVFGIKLQLLHVLRGTDLASDYERGTFETLAKEDYPDLIAQCIRHLSPEIVVHRLTGDGPRNQTISPRWSLNKRDVLTVFKTFTGNRSLPGTVIFIRKEQLTWILLLPGNPWSFIN